MLQNCTSSAPSSPADAQCAQHDPFDDALQSSPADSETAPANDLLAAMPARDLVLVDDLIRAFTRPPIVIIRQAGIAVATLLAWVGSIALHLFLAGLFVAALYFGFGFAHAGHGSGDAVVYTQGGGAGDGYMILGDGPVGPPTLEGAVKNLLAHASETAQVEMPTLPPTLPAEVRPEPLVNNVGEPDIIGLASTTSLTGELKPRIVRTPNPRNVSIAPPSRTTSVALAGSTGAIARSPRGGSGAGGGDDEEPLIQIFKPGHGGGDGDGRGSKTGSGIDRGESGANNPHPQILELAEMRLPDSVLRNPPTRNTKFELTVLPDGTPDKKSIKLIQSCGRPDLDELWKSALLHSKFLPAYAAGKPYAASDTYTYLFNPSEKDEAKN